METTKVSNRKTATKAPTRTCLFQDSDLLSVASWNPINRVLRIYFLNSDGIYEYNDVPGYVFGGLCAAESPGQFYNAAIKGKFDGVNIHSEVTATS